MAGATRRVPPARLHHCAGCEVVAEPGEPEVIFCVDEFGPLNLPPHPGRQWAVVSGKNAEHGRTALRYGTSPLTAPATSPHEQQGSMIGRYIIWRNNHAYDQRLRRIAARANVA